jgi:uncharacterized protein (DUF924 family)
LIKDSDVSGDARSILDFWFEEVGPDRWWTRSDATDEVIRRRFLPLWERWRGRPAESFLTTPSEALAAVVLFDQFPRNMFRGEGRAFATDGLALAITEAAVDRGFDQALTEDERVFLYMPLMHAEDLAKQDRCVALFEALGRPEQVRYAREHRAIIARHGRFPARNAALGRKTRPEEQDAIAASRNW